jgi:hypothetical protein
MLMLLGVTVSHPIAVITLVRTRPKPILVTLVAQGATYYGMMDTMYLIL